LRYCGRKLEVKCSAYLQSWPQNGLSRIVFDIGRKLPWDAETNTYGTTPVRSADVYVFCLFAATDRGAADVLDMDQWEFYVVPAAQIDTALGDRKAVGLKALRSICEAAAYAELRDRIDAAVVRASPP